jgi:hypothetical protein
METRTAAPSTNTCPADTPVQRPSFAIPLFGVHGGNNADAYLWSEQDEIE